MAKKTITVASWKGGTGKTTLNILLVEILSRRGYKTLIIDLESNCAITQCYGAIAKALQDKEKTSMGFLMGSGSDFHSDGIIHAKDNVDIIPSHLQNALLANIMDSQLKLNIKRAGFLDQYDYIIIDPPGFWGSHTKNAVVASDTLIIPGMGSTLDFEASTLFVNTLNQCGIDADVYVCVNAYNQKTCLPGILERYQERFGEYLTPTVPYITSLKKLVDNVNYAIHPSVRKRLEEFVEHIIGGNNAQVEVCI
jgi:cellulose biosynthesis protein BcsQ